MMRRWITILAAAMTTGLAGCQAPQTPGGEPERGKPPKSPKVLAKVIQLKSLTVRETYKLDEVLLFTEIGDNGCTVQFLASPNPSGGPGTITYGYVGNEPVIDVENGWVYVVVCSPSPNTGSNWGKARTKRISGTAHGTHFLVQQQGQEPKDMHRVIQLTKAPDTVHVELLPPASGAQDLTGIGMYFEVEDSPQKLPPVTPSIDPNSEVGRLIPEVKKVVVAAGLPW